MWFTSNIYGLDVYFSMPCVQLLLFIVCQPNVVLQQNCLKGDQGNLKCLRELNDLEGTTGSKSGTNVDSADFQKVHKTVLFISFFFLCVEAVHAEFNTKQRGSRCPDQTSHFRLIIQ